MKNTTQTQMKTPKVGGNKTSIRFYEPLEPNGSEEAKLPGVSIEQPIYPLVRGVPVKRFQLGA